MTEPEYKRRPGRPPKHGAYSKFALVPLTSEKIIEIKEIIAGERSAVAPADVLMINLLARVLAQIDLMSKFLSEHGYFADEERGQPWPVVQPLLAAIDKAAKICDKLGLTTDARLRMGRNLLETEDLATKIQRAREH